MGDMYAPVAEYRGVAILENANGNRRAEWNGVEYFTDGKVYFFGDGGPGMLRLLRFETEREAKDVLDHCLVGERLLQSDNGSIRLLSRDDCVRVLCQDDPEAMALGLALEPCRIWDEDAGVFVRAGERQPWVDDGQHRHCR